MMAYCIIIIINNRVFVIWKLVVHFTSRKSRLRWNKKNLIEQSPPSVCPISVKKKTVCIHIRFVFYSSLPACRPLLWLKGSHIIYVTSLSTTTNFNTEKIQSFHFYWYVRPFISHMKYEVRTMLMKCGKKYLISEFTCYSIKVHSNVIIIDDQVSCICFRNRYFNIESGWINWTRDNYCRYLRRACGQNVKRCRDIVTSHGIELRWQKGSIFLHARIHDLLKRENINSVNYAFWSYDHWCWLFFICQNDINFAHSCSFIWNAKMLQIFGRFLNK